jgi:hypothetical protein
MSDCTHCAGIGWVCEGHPHLPWDEVKGCECSAGEPCPYCNSTDGEVPRMPPGTTIISSAEENGDD